MGTVYVDFDETLRRKVALHCHALVLDGVYTAANVLQDADRTVSAAGRYNSREAGRLTTTYKETTQ